MTEFAALRTTVARFLVDSCTIASPADPEFDDDLGYETVGVGAAVYSGVCRIRPTGGQERVHLAGEALVTLRTFDLTLPWDTTGVKVGQRATITSSEDPHMIDRVFRVVDVQGGSDGAYRRLIVEDTLDVDEGGEVGS